jgi:putative ABC transport system permease protein
MAWLPIRTVLKRPGLSALAVIALGLGIGLTTMMFSIINGVILRGLPFEQADRIALVGAYDTKRPEPPRPGHMAAGVFFDVRKAQRSFEDLGASYDGDVTLLGADGIPLRYAGAQLTPNVLHLLRVAPLKGRGFTEADAQPGAERVVLLGERVWNAQFQRDPDVVGRMIRVDGEPATNVGVMPASFGFPEHQHVWLPMRFGGGADPRNGLEVFGRLRDGTSIEAANAELARLAATIRPSYPEERDFGLMSQTYIDRKLPQRTVATFWTMLAAVFGVLLIACVNVANLQLARAADRTREVAIRLALGAGRGRVVREFLIEGLLLSAAGTLVGLLIARAGLTLIWQNINDPSTPFWISFDMDLRVLLFATLLTVFAAMASSLIPALRATRGRPNDALKDEGRGATGLRIGRLSRALVVAQVALSFGLLMASGLVIKSIVNAKLVPIPFRTDVLTGRLDLSGPAYKDDAALRAILDRLHDRVIAVPGVSSVTFASGVPGFSNEYLDIDGQVTVDGPGAQRAEILAVAPDYLDVMGLRITTGRGILPADRHGAELVALVSDDFAARHFSNESPIGRRFRVRRSGGTPAPWRTIVGTFPSLGNPAASGRDHNATAMIPLDQRPTRNVEMVIAGAAETLAPAGEIRRAVAQVDQAIVIDRFTTVQGRYDERTWPVRVFGGLFSAFGIAAMLLASAGLYGVMAFAVRRRTAEIGIRMALGANRSNILRLIVRQGMGLLGIGLALGAGLGFLLSSQLTQLLFQVQPWDVSVVLTTFLVLVASGLAASFVPARRAAAVDPLVALRTE